MPLYWRVCLINGLVFVVGTAALALAPVTVSATVLVSEAVVLVLGLVGIVVLNSVLLRTSLAPLDRLIRLMDTVDLQRPGRRLPESGTGAVGQLVRGFNAMLERLETERGRSNAKALAAQEAERHRIARELHDEIGQGLTAVLLGLKQLSSGVPAAVQLQLMEVQETARATLDEVGGVARRLRPGVLEDLGLQSALASLATDFSSHGMHVRRATSPGLPELGSERELVIYRVAQEALTNAARHSNARTVRLSLQRQGMAVILAVEDDGTGLRGAEEGTGIHGMRERALLIGAELTVGPGESGTAVRLTVPLEAGR
ncbi:sensor histidine kinase [Kribbella sp. NBC_00709]|uniref:sensor histidine kinase n=1 Tax=Kribbella sp. NBC_00709 TaxID=2975972 RepID=UPI002E2CA9C5|nr:sensor histidine kinase [Kribbella sp. NBC_00709]